jgi:PhnB protein
MTQVNPYLNFNGNCREAMTFYQECLGGELALQTVGDSPMGGQLPEEAKQTILHATLVREGLVLMASDMTHGKLINGNTIWLCVQCSSEMEIKTLFTNLSVGGKILDPLVDQFWGAIYGSLTDKFGKYWMLNYDKKSPN